jgi:hypothetical protein
VRDVLYRRTSADVRVYVVWLPMLATDSRSEWDADVIPDPRVRHFWDPDRVVGTWFADENVGGLGYSGIVWDAFFVFEASARWAERPDPLTSSGAPVVEYQSEIERAVANANRLMLPKE